MANIKEASEILNTKLDKLGYNGCGELPISLSSFKKLYNTYGNQIFHVAAEYNYAHLTFTLIKYELGDHTIKNSEGMSPFMIALSHENFDVARILKGEYTPPRFITFPPVLYLLKNVIPLIPESTLEKLGIAVINKYTNDFVSKLRRKRFSSEIIGKALALVTKFGPCNVVQLRDPVITQEYFQSASRYFTFEMTFETVGKDLQHTLVILRHAPRSKWSSFFCSYVMDNICRLHRSRSGRKYLKGIFILEVFNDDETLKCLDEKLRTAKKKNVKIFLKYNLHAIIKANSGRDILASLFGEYPAISYLRDEDIDVDGRGFEDKTPLHFAAEKNLIENLQILLQRGADPNALDNNGRTPLSLAIFNEGYEECIKWLLVYGANPLLAYDRIREIFSSRNCSFGNDFIIVRQFLVAQLLIYESLGMKNYKSTRLLDILWDKQFGKFVEDCRQQLCEFKMKKLCDVQEISNSDITLFAILTESMEKLFNHVSKVDVQAILTFVECNEKIISFYRSLLKMRAEDILYVQDCKKRTLSVVGKFIGIPDPYHLVVNKIANYLDVKDFRRLSILDKQDVTYKHKAERFFKLTRKSVPKVLAYN